MVVDAVCVISFISIEPVTPPTLSTAAAVEGDAQYKHSASKTLGCAKRNATCSRLSIVRFANGPKRSMGHVLGAKKEFFLIRGRWRPTVYGGRTSGILSIRGPEVSLGSLRVGTIHVQSPTPHTPPLQSFLADFSQQTTRFSHLLAMVCFQGSPRALGCGIDGVCGAGAYPLPELPRETSRSRSAPEKSVQFGPDGAPFPSKTSITRGPPVVAVAVSLDPILPHR